MDNDALERLERRVDTKGTSEPVVRRPLQSEGLDAPHEWQTEPPHTPSRLMRTITHLSPLELLFAASIVFFVAAGAIAGLLIFSGTNTVSSRNVDISLSGPTGVRAGEEVTLQLVITNRNAVPMNLTDILIEFPSGTRQPSDVSEDLLRTRESVGTIEPGASINRTVKAVLFGTAGIPVAVTATAEYRVPGSNAVFQSSTVYNTLISQSPAAVTVKGLTEVVSGQATELVVTVTSNATEVLTGMLLTATYPPGFDFTSATPKPAAGTSVWDLGDIEPSGERTVSIRGTFTGEDGEDRVLHFTTGAKKKADPTTIAAPLAATDTTIAVAKPFVSVALLLEGKTGTVFAPRGEVVQGEVHWANNLPVRVQNVEITVKLSGSILNKQLVRTGQGFYRSADSTLIFNKTTDPRLADVEPGMSGVLDFEIATLPVGQGSFQSPSVSLHATVKGNRSSEGGVVSVVESSADATLQVATDIAFTPVLTRVAGPVPPKAETETVYTVTWLLQNSANTIANANVSAVVPNYVSWRGGASSPDVVYNDDARTITWSVGDMNANTSKSVSFTIALTPSLTQVNNIVNLLNDVRVTAFDRFIRAQIERPQPPVTSQTSTTPQMGVVVP
jgi:hypothetical protein